MGWEAICSDLNICLPARLMWDDVVENMWLFHDALMLNLVSFFWSQFELCITYSFYILVILFVHTSLTSSSLFEIYACFGQWGHCQLLSVGWDSIHCIFNLDPSSKWMIQMDFAENEAIFKIFVSHDNLRLRLLVGN